MRTVHFTVDEKRTAAGRDARAHGASVAVHLEAILTVQITERFLVSLTSWLHPEPHNSINSEFCWPFQAKDHWMWKVKGKAKSSGYTLTSRVLL